MAKPLRATRHLIGYGTFVVLVAVARLLPRCIALCLFSNIAVVVGRVLKKERLLIIDNLQRAFGDHYSEKELNKMVCALYRNIGFSLCDTIKLPYLPAKKFLEIVHIENENYLHTAREKGKGVIVLAGHMAGFELQTQLVAQLGIPSFTVGAQLFDSRVESLFTSLRTRNGVSYFTRDGAAKNILRHLRKNELFGALIDQDATSDGVFATFFGIPAFTPSAPMRIALRYDIPVVWAFMHRTKEHQYILQIKEPPCCIRTGDYERDLVENIQQFNDAFCAHIARYPDQWVWMHRRWRRKEADMPHVPSISKYRKEHV